MRFCLLLLLLVVVVEGVWSSSSVPGSSVFGGVCPEPVCECLLDESGRMEVRCVGGRMEDIPTGRMHPGTEIIRVVGSDAHPNRITIGRVFGKMKKLEEIHVVSSNVPSIGENSFWGLGSLRVLDLSGNNISMVVESNFKGLVGVDELILRDNKLESFVSASFQHLPRLKSLDLSSNRVGKLVERLFYNLHMLEALDLSWNRDVKELHPDVFRDIWRLKVLKCRGCGLKHINPLLYALLPDLEELDLGQNGFKYLSRDEFVGLSRLRVLLLDGNGLSAVTDETFRGLRLRRLSLGSNRIVRVDRGAFFNASVGALDLSGNQFEGVERGALGQLQLVEIDLSRSPRMKVGNLLLLLGELGGLVERVNLCCNGLEEVPADLFEMQRRSLVGLNLSWNRFGGSGGGLWGSLRGMERLDLVDLRGNRLRGVRGEELGLKGALGLVKEVLLQGNPFFCDYCHVGELVGWGKRRWGVVSGDGGGMMKCRTDGDVGAAAASEGCMRCAGPVGYENVSVTSLEESELPYCIGDDKLDVNGDDDSDSEVFSSLAGDPRLTLVIGCGVIVLVLVVLAVASIILRGRKGAAGGGGGWWGHAAHYYTHEAERPEINTPPVPPTPSEYKSSVDAFWGGGVGVSHTGGYKNNMIATIDEINFVDYPELDTSSSFNSGDVIIGNNGGSGNNGGVVLVPPRGYR